MKTPIIPALHDRQHHRGYLTDEDMRKIAEDLGVPLHRVQSVVSFFPHFRTTPPAKVCVHVCRDMACHLRGADQTIENLKKWGDGLGDGEVEVHPASCLGRCDRPAAAMVNEQLVAPASEDRLKFVVSELLRGKNPEFDSDLDTCGDRVGQWDMDVYDGQCDYAAVRQFVAGGDADKTLAALEHASLLGMGGAGGRAYKKWGDVRDAKGTSGEKYVVCNADESEPGTFKDREILMISPYLTIEGMIIAAMVTGAQEGWIYIRHEYPEQIARCREEIDRARKMGAVGRNIFGSTFSFELSVFPSPGGYICGEQTALIEAMENKRAEPRNRPPELMTNGLHNQPTLLSNVETFAWVPAILRDEGSWFAQQGIRNTALAKGSEKKIKGKRLFSISGDVANPGVYEVSTGITLGDLIDQHCQGMRDGIDIVAVALSGPSGGLLPAMIPVEAFSRRFVESNVPPDVTHISVRDLPLDINVSRAVGYMLGAGIVIYGEGTDVLSEAVANSDFYRRESCGKCVPCRIGSTKITEMGQRMQRGEVQPEELATLQSTTLELATVMQATSICGLGQVAANPLQTFLKFFPEQAAAVAVGGRKSGSNPASGEASNRDSTHIDQSGQSR